MTPVQNSCCSKHFSLRTHEQNVCDLLVNMNVYSDTSFLMGSMTLVYIEAYETRLGLEFLNILSF